MFLKRRFLLINYSLRSYRTDKAPKFHLLHAWMVSHLIPLQSAHSGAASLQKRAGSLGAEGVPKAQISAGGPRWKRWSV